MKRNRKIQGLCLQCGIRKQTSAGYGNYGKFCCKCKAEKYGMTYKSGKRKKSALVVKGSTCEECGFIPKHSCQLDLDHIDGDRNNNDPSNYRTLCANCHRLKTFKNTDYLKKPIVKPDLDWGWLSFPQ